MRSFTRPIPASFRAWRKVTQLVLDSPWQSSNPMGWVEWLQSKEEATRIFHPSPQCPPSMKSMGALFLKNSTAFFNTQKAMSTSAVMVSRFTFSKCHPSTAGSWWRTAHSSSGCRATRCSLPQWSRRFSWCSPSRWEICVRGNRPQILVSVVGLQVVFETHHCFFCFFLVASRVETKGCNVLWSVVVSCLFWKVWKKQWTRRSVSDRNPRLGMRDRQKRNSWCERFSYLRKQLLHPDKSHQYWAHLLVRIGWLELLSRVIKRGLQNADVVPSTSVWNLSSLGKSTNHFISYPSLRIINSLESSPLNTSVQ